MEEVFSYKSSLLNMNTFLKPKMMLLQSFLMLQVRNECKYFVNSVSGIEDSEMDLLEFSYT